MRASVRKQVVDEERKEEHQHNDLQDETRFGDVHTDIYGAESFTCRGKSTACGLKHKADDIGGNEEVIEELGVEAGDGCVGEDYTRALSASVRLR